MRAAILTLLALAAPARPEVPGDRAAAEAALRDVRTLPPELRPHVRYLLRSRRGAYPKFYKVLNFQVHSLSTEPEFAPPAELTRELLRVNLKDYGWKREVWERLATVEPYLHLAVVEEGAAPAHVPAPKQEARWVSYDKGKTFRREVIAEYVPAAPAAPKVVNKPAPWGGPALAELGKELHSEAPLLRADWFVHQTGVAKDRVAGYYAWLNLGEEEKDFQQLIGADPEKARRRKKEAAASVAESDVTINNRSIEWQEALGPGGYFLTSDFLKSFGRQNVLRVLKGETEPPRGDATEQYGFLPCDLFAYWLGNAERKRQDEAPSNIAGDSESTRKGDRRVQVMLSCVRCHKEGLRPVDDWVRRVYQGNPSALANKDYDKFKRIQRLYLSDLKGRLAEGNERYAKALARLNGEGWTARVNSDAYGEEWRLYADTSLSVKEVADEHYTTPIHLVTVLTEYAKELRAKGGEADPLIDGLIAGDPPPLRREHHEEIYPLVRSLVEAGRR